MIPFSETHKKTIAIAGVVALALLIIGVIVSFASNSFEVGGKTGLLSKFNPRIGNSYCETSTERPYAVMLAGDPETRPLSGIGLADIVFEMPVTESGVNRFMAVYQCNHPTEIGSIRSARLDFIPLVQGLDAIYAHWGGEHNALEELNDGIVDNINGLLFDGTTYYRKTSIPRPHNGFTNYELLTKKATDLGYTLGGEPYVYEFEKGKSRGSVDPVDRYGGDFKASWTYEPSNNTYLRFRANRPEIDRLTGEQVEAANVVILDTTWSPIDVNYIRVKTVGHGTATVYKNGGAIQGTWEKPTAESPLLFFDENGDTIRFAQGMIWIEISI